MEFGFNVECLSGYLQPIGKGGIVYNNCPWHRDCFCCSHCQRVLGRERFTSVEDRPYCVDCYGQLFAKKCSTCTKPITGACRSDTGTALIDCVEVLRPTRHKTGHFGDVLLSQSLGVVLKKKLECGPMPNLMVALPNMGGALCSTPQSLADAHY